MAFVAQRLKNGGAIDYVPASDVAAGDVVIVGNMVGIAPVPIPAGKLGAIETCGTFRIATASATTFAIGDPVYFDTDNAVCTAVGTDILIGYAVKACANGETSVDVYLAPVTSEGASSSGS